MIIQSTTVSLPVLSDQSNQSVIDIRLFAWFTSNHAHIFSDTSNPILLCLPAVSKSMPLAENSLSTKVCEAGADTKSCTVSVREEHTFDSSFSGAERLQQKLIDLVQLVAPLPQIAVKSASTLCWL